MKHYLQFIETVRKSVSAARHIPRPDTAPPPEIDPQRPTVLLFSPHPDDECITGVLPLRLMRELGKQIVNVPVTYGSRKDRQAARARELDAACGYLGWSVWHGDREHAQLTVAGVLEALETFRPEAIVMPHDADWNPRHVWTHNLVMEALGNAADDFACHVVETEYWGAMSDPNLMVEADAQCLADLVAATSLHVGEVERNPYHLLLPAWMQDNVRRGGELVGGAGAAAPSFEFATLYRLRHWSGGTFTPAREHGTYISADAETLKEELPWK